MHLRGVPYRADTPGRRPQGRRPLRQFLVRGPRSTRGSAATTLRAARLHRQRRGRRMCWERSRKQGLRHEASVCGVCPLFGRRAILARASGVRLIWVRRAVVFLRARGHSTPESTPCSTARETDSLCRERRQESPRAAVSLRLSRPFAENSPQPCLSLRRGGAASLRAADSCVPSSPSLSSSRSGALAAGVVCGILCSVNGVRRLGASSSTPLRWEMASRNRSSAVVVGGEKL